MDNIDRSDVEFRWCIEFGMATLLDSGIYRHEPGRELLAVWDVLAQGVMLTETLGIM